MTNVLEYRLKQLQNIIFEAEQSIKNAGKDIDKETIKQRKLFLAKCKNEEKEILEMLGVKTQTKKEDNKQDAKKDDKKQTKKQTKKQDNKQDKKEE